MQVGRYAGCSSGLAVSSVSLLSCRSALQIVEDARRGRVPDRPNHLAARVAKLYGLQDKVPALDVTRMLSYDRTALSKPHAAVAANFATLGRMLPNASVSARRALHCAFTTCRTVAQ